MFEGGYSREKRVNSEQIIIRSSEKTIINSFYIFVYVLLMLSAGVCLSITKKKNKGKHEGA
jgi:hypothetical protein